ncbi:hypothetical protein [Phenylobacterium sp. J367]|uniref:hypothetical protein n=1 Tax=Phenylobacterium sp. J367 TaxID=2898435 RepID=UPI002151B380|nr:hypothetical protein [Phenylobacterium sp. J367]MCR5877289.1 hypothetical protein [Phenylobacterium sp. J367]
MSDSEPATTRSPSRRRLLQGVTALSLPIPSLTGATDPGKVVAERYCALEQEQRRLHTAWSDVESWLHRHRNWPRLTQAEQAAVPEAAQFAVIEAQLDAIDKQYDALVPLLKTTSACTRDGVIARLDALLWFLNPYDNADAYPLLQSCQDDLKRLWL